MASRICNVPNHVNDVEAVAAAYLVDAHERRAARLLAPQHKAVAPLSPNRAVAELIQSFVVQWLVPKEAVITLASPIPAIAADAKTTNGATAVPADAKGARQVSACTKKTSASTLQPAFIFKRNNNYGTTFIVVFANTNHGNKCAKCNCFA